MPHHMCATCRIRSRTGARPAGVSTSPCPICGSPLELVRDLSSIVGFRQMIPIADPREGPGWDDYVEEIACAAAVALPLPGRGI